MPTADKGRPAAASSVQLRSRRLEDVPTLIDVLARQQPTSRYPFRWPPPFAAEDFIVRPDERAAWVAELDGRVVGHVSVTGIAGDAAHDQLVAAWTRAIGVGPESLGCLSVLFSDIDARGRGVGTALMETAESWIADHGLHAVLDGRPGGAAMALYLSRGWRFVGEARPPWLPDDEPAMHAMVLDLSTH